MWGMFRFFNAQEQAKELKPGPMAMTTKEERLPPTPRLQAAPGFEVILANGQKVKLEKREPEAEYRVVREQWERQLYCKTDELPHGTIADKPACVPIDSAIDQLFARGGLPVRPQAKDSGNVAEISLPTAASSGRVTGKGKE
jgi:hypothetical protein